MKMRWTVDRTNECGADGRSRHGFTLIELLVVIAIIVRAALQQINKSSAANPKLDTKEMYELRAKMFQAVHGTARF